MDNRGYKKPSAGRTMKFGFKDSEYFDASELRAGQKKTNYSNYNEEEEASQYGFSKSVTKRNAKGGRKEKKVNHSKLRVLFGTVAALIGIVAGVALFLFWYKEYLLNQITYETTDPTEIATIVNENGETVALSDAMEPTVNGVVQDETIKNFLLIGIDSRNKNYSKSGKGLSIRRIRRSSFYRLQETLMRISRAIRSLIRSMLRCLTAEQRFCRQLSRAY